MSMWLYQMSQELWEPGQYRVDIWEGERWRWPVGKIVGDAEPKQGDTVVFYYAQTGCADPGFYGWAVITEWLPRAGDDQTRMYFRPVAPSDHLKMHPWWDKKAKALAKQIRGNMTQATLWPVQENLRDSLRQGITRCVFGQLVQV